MFRFHLAHRAVALCLVALAAAPSLAADATCAPPTPDAAWPASSPVEAGFDARALCAALEAAVAAPVALHAVVVERRGRLVAESYRTGPDRPIDVLYGLGNPLAADVVFDASALHDVRSISKSVVGLLVGNAVREGKIAGLSAPALDSFPELADLRGDGRDLITIEHLLTMSSGLEWREWDAGPLTSDETRLFWKRDQIRFAFDRPLAHEPGSSFGYNSSSTTTLAEILVRATGKPLPELAATQIFEPLGIETWEWATDFRDRPLAFAGLRLRPRDLVKLGRLLLQGGRFGDRQVVPAEWVAASLRPHVSTAAAFGPDPPPFAPRGYGYQWWNGTLPWRGREVAWSAGFGNGGQRVYVVPELDLTVVTAAGDYGEMEINRVVGRLFAAIVAAVVE